MNECTGGVREEDVRRVISDIEGARWKALKRKRQLERNPNARVLSHRSLPSPGHGIPTLVYCPIAVDPRRRCSKGKSRKSRTDPLQSPDNVSFVAFSFCDLCQRSWHGLALYPTSYTSRLLLEYLAHYEGSPGRKAMNQRFGSKGNLE